MFYSTFGVAIAMPYLVLIDRTNCLEKNIEVIILVKMGKVGCHQR
jgi:hypothetical protein